jgi:hypothetical protein
MNWSDVTIFQYQQMQNLFSKKESGDTDLDIAVKTLAILINRTESQIDSLSVRDLTYQLKKIDFVTNTQPQPKPVDYIKVNDNRYRCIYDVRNMPYARYIETKFFGEDTLNNIHKIGASMIRPMKKTWRGWVLDKYDASKHEEYAQDLLSAPFQQVYGSVVFFCQVFTNSIKNLADYFKAEMIKKGMSKEEAEIQVAILCKSMDGFIKLPLSQNTKDSILKMPTKFQQFKH